VTDTVWREFDAVRLNAILNNPEVRPWVADAVEGVIDVSPNVASRDNVLLMGEHGGVLFFKLTNGIYEAHTQVMPEARGAWTLEMTRAAVYWMFTRTDAFEVLTRVPQGHIAAKGAAEATGLSYEFTRPMELTFRGKVRDVHIHGLTIQKWATQADGLIDRGQWFHRRLAEEAKRLGITEPPHEDDENHNRYVGAALEMAMHSQPVKAVQFYNRWATVSRHKPVQLVTFDPVVVKFDIGRLLIGSDDVEVVPELAEWRI